MQPSKRDHQAEYQELGELVATVPTDLTGPGPINAETHRWLGRVAALVETQGNDLLNDTAAAIDATAFASAVSELGMTLMRAQSGCPGSRSSCGTRRTLRRPRRRSGEPQRSLLLAIFLGKFYQQMS